MITPHQHLEGVDVQAHQLIISCVSHGPTAVRSLDKSHQHIHGVVRAGEFAAHAAAVNCLRIGRKSSGVLVTGGEDKKVNVWAIGKPSAILVGAIIATMV